jgi:asparagine N-glycosylation enzyme membrane subunit Stt3
MAMKMIYLAVYPAAVLAALGLGAVLNRAPVPRVATAWVTTVVVLGVGLRAAMVAPVPLPIVSVDLDEAGRWARANLPAECVDYVVSNAEQAYWLHLAVMGQPRSSARTADIDGYTANRAVGRWIEGTALPYAIALHELLPGEVLGNAEVVRRFGSAMIIKRAGAGC